MLENRQKIGWDAKLPGKGLMITHIDFDKTIWEDNTPNTKVTSADLSTYGYHKTNDHQRYSIVCADNEDDIRYWSSYGGYYTQSTTSNDLYPYNTNDSLTDTSKPAATLFNKNTDDSKLLHKPITAIKQNSDKTISFKFLGATGSVTPPDNPPVDPPVPDEPYVAHGDTLFYESFDQCNGTGANDGIWSTYIAGSSSKFHPDVNGWIVTGNASYAGYQCARFGNASTVGMVTTPLFTLNGSAKLTFKAAAWNTDGTSLSLSVNNDDVTISTPTLTMKSFEWTEYTITLKGNATVRLTFLPDKRFLLDEVLVMKKNTSVGISHQPSALDPQPSAIYTLDGRYVGNNLDMLRPGIYVINGKKVVR